MRDDTGTSLRVAYAWALLGTHALVWLFFANTRVLTFATASVEPFCWPYFESCWQWRLPSTADVVFLQLGHLVLLSGAASALWHRKLRIFWWGLVALNAYLFAMVSLDYRLRANEFYMLFWVHGVFLISGPRYRWTVAVAIVSCYFWAGTLKLNYEWLSGAVLYKDLWLIPKPFVPAACAYVVFLEMVAIWGLLARRAAAIALTLAQLALFHLQSLSQIHWFYPMLMTTLLSWFVMERLLAPEGGRASLTELIKFRAPASAYLVLGIFGAMQMAPALFRGDSTLTGQGRSFALHMFEARQQCEVTAFTSDVAGDVGPVDLKIATLAPRLVCDPVVYFNRAQNLCRSRRLADAKFDLRLLMRAKRATDLEFQTIIDEDAFCSKQHEYAMLRNNSWLK